MPLSAAYDTIRFFGVDLARVDRQVDRIRDRLPVLAATFVPLVAEAPDPLFALAAWERLMDAAPDSGELASWPFEHWQALFRLLGGSPSLSNVLHGSDAAWPKVFKMALTAPRRQAAEHTEALRSSLAAEWDSFCEALRRYRHREYLRIGLADLVGWYPVEVTVAELTALAAGLTDAAYEWARGSLGAVHGELLRQDGTPMPFVIFGMGKLGGGELNFSSDVDLVYLYESDQGGSAGGSKGVLEPRAYFTRLAELVTRALSEVTAAGFAFRVDLRLRPDGMNGPIVNPLSNALLYYESYGQTWERTALIQARPIGGSRQLGESFLREVHPFVYRRYLDYSTVSDMKEMKARVESQLGGKSGRGNVKLGRGGIREIEFLVQVFQLIHGGRDERVRTRGTLVTLQRLVECRYLPPEEGAALAAAYRFLRDVEHKIQIAQQRQTHTIPADLREQCVLARRLGYRGQEAASELWPELQRHNDFVRRSFEKLFHEPAAETRRSADAATDHLIRSLPDREGSIGVLEELGFAEPERAYENLCALRDGPVGARTRPKYRQILDELAPALLQALLRSPNPGLALENLVRFILSVGARTSFLLLLRENPGTLRMLVQLFGASQFLANAFLRRPELLDSLVRADLVRVQRPVPDLLAELKSLMDAAEGFEAALDTLRRFRNQEFLRIGINDLQAVLDPEQVVAELAALAEACVRTACDVAAQDMCARTRRERLPGEYVIIAMGKLGGGELNYNSDLDLIFVYEPRDNEQARAEAHEIFTKFVQRLITVLQVPTPEGLVYRIDTRLRPSGHSGPLVSSLEGFRRYHEESAQVWERQALIKARPIAGDPALAGRVETVIADFVYRHPLAPDDVREIRRLRGRMERELAKEDPQHLNIKTGRGGLVDVEFVTQMLQLHYGAEVSTVRGRNTVVALAALADAGILNSEDHTVLRDGYRFIRRVESALRLAHDRPVEDLDRGNLDLAVVARRLGFGGEDGAVVEALWDEFQQRREAIRSCYDRWFDRMESAATEAPQVRV